MIAFYQVFSPYLHGNVMQSLFKYVDNGSNNEENMNSKEKVEDFQIDTGAAEPLGTTNM